MNTRPSSTTSVVPIYVRQIGWLALLVLALVIGGWSLRYALPRPPDVPPLESFKAEHLAFIIHAVTASIALLLGPWQLLRVLRQHRPLLHKWVGRAYVLVVAIAWLASVPIAMRAHTGGAAVAGFLSLGFAWLCCTAQGLRAALRRQFESHREWMLRSYSLTAAGITLRIYLGVVSAAHWQVNEVYAAIAWLCWVPNIASAEILIRATLPVTAGGRKRR